MVTSKKSIDFKLHFIVIDKPQSLNTLAICFLFPKDHQMQVIFNKNCVKVSYSCMNNITSISSTYNKNILKPKQISFSCNCRNKDNFPRNGECLTPNIIYQADITTDNDHKFYYGTSEKKL